VDATSIAKDDIFGQPWNDPVDTCHHRLHHFYSTQMSKGLLRILACERDDPDVYIESFYGVARDPHDLGFSWKIYQ